MISQVEAGRHWAGWSSPGARELHPWSKRHQMPLNPRSRIGLHWLHAWNLLVASLTYHAVNLTFRLLNGSMTGGRIGAAVQNRWAYSQGIVDGHMQGMPDPSLPNRMNAMPAAE